MINKIAVSPLNSHFKFRVKVDKVNAFKGRISKMNWSEDKSEFDAMLGIKNRKSSLKIKKKKSSTASGKKKAQK